MMNSVLEHIKYYATKIPESEAFVYNDIPMNYQEFWNKIVNYAAFLHESGIKHGYHVIIRNSQNDEYLIAYFAVQLVGGIVSGTEKNIPPEKLAEIAEQLDADAFISDNDTSLYLCKRSLIFFNQHEILKRASVQPEINIKFKMPERDSIAEIAFTIGTTGASKGVQLSYGSILITAEKLADAYNYQSNTLFINPGPLNHVRGIWENGAVLVRGGTFYLLEGMLDLRAFFRAMNYAKEKIALCLVPSHMRSLILFSANELKRFEGKISFITLGSAPVLDSDKEQLCSLLPSTRTLVVYGSSECGIITCYDFNLLQGLSNCVGKVLPGSEILTVDEMHQPCHTSSSNTGLLAFRTTSLMNGYYGAPELTNDVLVDGVVYTNDVGYIDDNGFLYICERKGDVINIGGLKVSPLEIENAALLIDEIADCICIGVPDAVGGNTLKLLVVMKEKGTLDSKKISSFLQKRLEAYKIPRKYEEIDKLAHTSNGKLDRKSYRK